MADTMMEFDPLRLSAKWPWKPGGHALAIEEIRSAETSDHFAAFHWGSQSFEVQQGQRQ